MSMREINFSVLKIALAGAAVIVVIAALFFNINNLIMWATLNDPFQNQWAVVQLSDGEILYGHLAGVNGTTIGLSDVYLLDKVAPVTTTPIVSTSTDLTMGATLGASATQQPTLIPVSDTPQLFINRAAVLYFKFLTPDDPAFPYLH